MIGIDIGNQFIKLVALGRYRGTWRLQACLAQESAPDPVQALQTILQLLPSRLRRKLPRVAIALPTTELLVKTVQLPSGLNQNQIELALRMEFEHALVPDAEKICLDYRLPATVDGVAVTDQKVLAVGCRQSLLDDAVAPLAGNGITPALVGADVMLIADKLSPLSCGAELDLFIDAGATGVRLHAMRAGVPGYSRNCSPAHHALAAESFCSDDPSGYLLLLRRAIQQYRMFDMLSKPDAIFVYGGAATLSGVPELLQQSFDLPVKCLDPFSHWQICADDLRKAAPDLHASAFTMACVLASQDTSCM